MSFEIIVETIRRYLPKRWRSYWHQIAIQLHAVAIGAKIGYVWDIGPTVQLTQVVDIVTELINRSVLMAGSVKVVVVGQDFCIVNVQKYLRRSLTDISFVDVSIGLASPKLILTDGPTFPILKEMLEIVDYQFKYQSDMVTITMHITDIFCVPTIFGLFAGYPIVYWYNPVDTTGSNCLSGVPLRIFQLLLHDQLIYSVSCPQELLLDNEDSLKQIVTTWFETLSGQHGLEFNSIEKTMSKVIM